VHAAFRYQRVVDTSAIKISALRVMKHGQNNRRQRSRGNNNNRRYPNQRGNSFESNGPEVKVRGTAQQVLEKYQSLARDAYSSGDRVLAEGYLQHAEHYYRVMNSEAENKDRENNQNRDNNRNRQGHNNRDDNQRNAESGDSQESHDQKQSDGDDKKSAEDVKVVEITTSESKPDEVTESATADAVANDVASEEPKPKKPGARRSRKTEPATEPVEQPQAGD